MNEQSNMPSAGAEGVAGWFSVWRDAITKPNEQNFVALATSSSAKASTAYIWIFIGSLVNVLFASLVQGALVRQMLQQMGMEGELPGGTMGGTLLSAICGAPVGAVIGVLVFAVVTAIVQWIAKMFGGRGTYEQLAYVFAAIFTPFYFISAILTLLSAIPLVGLCFSVLSLVAGLYALFLQVMAVKAVNQFGWGQALGSFLLPIVVIGCCLVLVIGGLVSLLAPAISETFDSINQSLP
jgi:hypothetical protein